MGEETATLETVARDLRAHVAGCEKIQRQNVRLHRTNTAALKKLAKGQGEIAAALGPIEDFLKLLRQINKYGRWGATIFVAGIISAFATVLVQNYTLHRDTQQATEKVAASAAQAAGSASQAAASASQAAKKLNQVVGGGAP